MLAYIVRRVLYAVPTMYRRLIDAAELEPEVRAGLSAARLLVSGSAALMFRTPITWPFAISGTPSQERSTGCPAALARMR